MCDLNAALIDYAHGDGCILRVEVGLADQWQQLALVVVALVLIALYAILIAQVRR